MQTQSLNPTVETKAMPNSKRARRENKPFGQQFFTPGTVCEIQVSRHGNAAPKVITVKDMVKNGPDSYVIRTGQMNPAIPDVEEGYNISHVTRIIKHVTGTVKLTNCFKATSFDGCDEQKTGHQFLGTIKHSSQYRTHCLSTLVVGVLSKMWKKEHLISVEKMVRMLQKQNVCQLIHTGNEYRPEFHVVNKKKFNKALKRLLPKCLLDHSKEQEDYDAFMFAASAFDDENYGD